MVKPLMIGCALVSLTSGCAYSHGEIRYTDHPELRSVYLYNGEEDKRGQDVAVVERRLEERGDCSDVAAKALGGLMEEAKALGADGVKNVKFRGKWNWMGRVVCRPEFSGSSVWVRGMAFKDTSAH